MTQTKDSPQTHAIKSLIQSFFDAINAADTTALGNLFFPNANLTIIRQDPPRAPSEDNFPQFTNIQGPETSEPDGPSSSATLNEDSNEDKNGKNKDSSTPVLRTPIESFIALLNAGKKRREGQPDLHIHERPDLDATRIKVEGLFAAAWSPFVVTFDGVLHQYGVLVYTLGKRGEGEKWRIEGLTQSYRRMVGWEGEREFL